MGGRTGSGGGLLLFGYVCLGEPLIRHLFFFFIFRKNSKSVKLLEIRRILRVFLLNFTRKFLACSNSKKIFFYFFNNQEKSQTPPYFEQFYGLRVLSKNKKKRKDT